jgi:hypothetical protein
MPALPGFTSACACLLILALIRVTAAQPDTLPSPSPLPLQSILPVAQPPLPETQAPQDQRAQKAGKTSDGRPIARIKKSIICCPREKIELDGWASIDVGGEVTSWLWDLNEDGKWDTVCSSGELIIAAPTKSRSYSVILCVQDNQGNLSDPDTAMVHVQDTPPSVSIRADTVVKVGVRVRFEPQVMAVCSPVVRYEWDLDDDGVYEYHSASDGKTSKVYYAPGKYPARFRVVDAAGHEAGAYTVVGVVDKLGAVASGTATAPAENNQKVQ